MRADGERFLLQAPRDARNQKTWRKARLVSGYLAQSDDTIWLYCSHTTDRDVTGLTEQFQIIFPLKDKNINQ